MYGKGGSDITSIKHQSMKGYMLGIGSVLHLVASLVHLYRLQSLISKSSWAESLAKLSLAPTCAFQDSRCIVISAEIP